MPPLYLRVVIFAQTSERTQLTHPPAGLLNGDLLCTQGRNAGYVNGDSFSVHYTNPETKGKGKTLYV